MSVGAQLQQARREQKLSLADVTARTKIQPWVLEALESDRLQEIMSPVYVKGFLTTYAKCLHLEPEPLIAALQWPQPKPAEDISAPTTSIPVAIRWSWPAGKRTTSLVAMTAALIALVVVNPLRWMPKGRLASAKPTKVAKSETARSLAQRPPAPVAKRTSAPPPHEPATASTPPLKLASVTPVSDSIKPPAPPTLTLLATQPLELTVMANRTTWVRVRADGKLLTQQRLPRGAKERWTAKKQLELIVSTPSQVDLTLNGQSISPFAIAHQGRLLITHHGVTKLPSNE